MRHDTPPGVAPSSAAELPSLELHELLTVEEVAALLKVNKSWVYEHTRGREVTTADRLPHIRSGGTCASMPKRYAPFVQRRANGR